MAEQLKEKERLAMLLKETQLQASKSDAKLEELRNKQHELEKKKQRASEKFIKAILKRHTIESVDEASQPFQTFLFKKFDFL